MLVRLQGGGGGQMGLPRVLRENSPMLLAVYFRQLFLV